MPEREERLIWIYAKSLDGAASHSVSKECNEFAEGWKECAVKCVTTVLADSVCDRLWLYRLATKDRSMTSRFVQHLEPRLLHLAPLPIKRRSNLPTPLLEPPAGRGTKIDIGLHPVNDAWNGALMMFMYYEGQRHYPPLFQCGEMAEYRDTALRLWSSHACDCHRPAGHCDRGCHQCFRIDCGKCRGTGWKRFSDWDRGGCRIDYASGWPVAIV